ncbi:MAG: hypothetical protein PHR61_01380 [Candidatus Absconditabacteria bacterium]|nr:hypothetical protein [Candidatus Absconditabacteria bacterium]
MENSLNFSSNAVRSMSKLMDKVGATCDQLIGALEVSKDGVSSYGVRITDNAMSTEFVDRVVGYLLLLKKHMFDLRKHVRTHMSFQEREQIAHVVEHLLETEDKLKAKMIENNYFNNTYGYLLEEIFEMLDAVVRKLPIK